MRLLAALVSLTLIGTAALAQDRVELGVGRLFSNDFLGDGKDRWRSGSYVLSYLVGPAGGQDAPQFGDIVEYRLRAEILTPGGPDVDDRPYVGAVSLGAHTHFVAGAAEVAMGADVVAIGPQTGLADFQDGFHDFLDLAPSAQQNPLPNDVRFSGSAEMGYPYALGGDVLVRPFVEARAGVEDLVRVGGDVLIGPVGDEALMLRDVATGQLYRGGGQGDPGVSYLIGGDIAAVAGSAYLPEDGGYVVSDTRSRARAGVMWRPTDDVTFFYGMTYLGAEFDRQPEGQVLGSLTLDFNF